MLLTRQQLRDFWNSLSPEERAEAEVDRQRQIAEDRALEAELVRQGQERMAQPVPYDPKNTKATSLTTRKVALRAMIASRHKIPTLWLENEAGERWVPDLSKWDGAPPGFVYQWSRFPTSLRETCLRTVEQSDVDACPHTDTKPDLGIIDTMEGRECVRCHGYQSRNKGEPWPEKWQAMGSREVMSGESTWPPDLVLAMVRPNETELAKSVERFGSEPRLLDMSDAISIAALSCERCLNALLWRYGLDDGYMPYSEQWDKTNTKCSICETPGAWDWLLNKPKATKRQATISERVAVRIAVEMGLGIEGLELTEQAPWEPTTPCCKCGKPSRIVLAIREDGPAYAAGLHQNNWQQGEFWFHDAASFALYLCPDINCGEVTTLWNQA